MSDDILLKSISNKRWVKKIFEYADPWYDITKINDTAKQLLLSYIPVYKIDLALHSTNNEYNVGFTSAIVSISS